MLFTLCENNGDLLFTVKRVCLEYLLKLGHLFKVFSSPLYMFASSPSEILCEGFFPPFSPEGKVINGNVLC